MQKKFEINREKIKGGCQSGRKVVTHNSKSDLPLVVVTNQILFLKNVYPFFSSFFMKNDNYTRTGPHLHLRLIVWHEMWRRFKK